MVRVAIDVAVAGNTKSNHIFILFHDFETTLQVSGACFDLKLYLYYFLCFFVFLLAVKSS